VEIPGDPKSFNLWLALGISLTISGLLVIYWLRSSRNQIQRSTNDVEQKHRNEERRLRSEFPAIFTFIESVGEIRSQKDFDQFLIQLNHLLEIERKARGIKWSEVKDIEEMKAIAFAKLIAKRNKKEDDY
jgi:hypothetical protein